MEAWLYVLLFFTLFNEEATFYKQFGRGGAILLVFFGEFIGYVREEASFYWADLGGGWLEFFFNYV